MAGVFEVFVDAESQYRFRLMAPNGTVLAVSAPFEDKRAAAAGIADVRECAGTGLIMDLSAAAPKVQEAAAAPQSLPAQSLPAQSIPAQSIPAQSLPAQPAHGRQGFGRKRGHWRPSAPAAPVRWTGAA